MTIIPTDPPSYEFPLTDWAAVNGSHNQTDNHSQIECTNDYCIPDADYLAMIEDYMFPTPSEWVLIALHVTVFVVGLVGNALVCVSVYRNHTMRTVTNYFIVNLAVADFLVILICLPPTVLWDVTETWFFGSLTCKLVLYLQSVSVSVSVLTLTYISVDRWRAICYPINFKSSGSRARSAIAVIWALSLAIAAPDVVVLDTSQERSPRANPLYLTDCTQTWDETHSRVYQLFLVVVLYALPLGLMGFTYYRIARVLWSRNIPGAAESNHYPAPRNCGMKLEGGRAIRPTTSSEGQVRSRKKASKMLFAVVIMFSLCYFPVHLINFLRVTIELKQTPTTTALSLISHWLCYANSAVNPIIYNIMNGKFRNEFKNMITCKCYKNNRRSLRSTTSYLCKYTSTVSHCDKRIHELANFS